MPFHTIDGVNYHYRRQGSGPPLLLLHGFSGSSLSWEEFVESAAQQMDVVSVDLLGHGETESPEPVERYGIEKAARDIAALAQNLGFDHFSLLGYSMGGRLALYFAHRYPKLVSKLILESASPGIEDAGERRRRKDWDYALAERIETYGVRHFVDEWEQLPLFASQTAVASRRRALLKEQRLTNNVVGLANSLRGMGTGSQTSLWRDLPSVVMPTLLICGALDAKYVEINSQMAGALPEPTLAIIHDAGHNIHFERPSRFSTVVTEFLKQSG